MNRLCGRWGIHSISCSVAQPLKRGYKNYYSINIREGEQLKTNSIKMNAFLNVLKTTSCVIFPLITFPYVSRVLEVESIGAYNFTSSVISYCLLFAGLGVSNYAIREGSQYRNNKAMMEEFISEVFTLNLISTILVYLTLFVLIMIVPKFESYSLGIILMSSEIVFATIGVSWVCNIYEDFAYIAIRTIFFQILSLLLIFLLLRSPLDYYRYLIITIISSSGANILNYFYIRKKYARFIIRLNKKVLKHLQPILIIFASTITITLYVNSDIIILGFMTNDYDVGLYSTAVKIYTVIKNLLVALLSVLVPRFSILFAKGNKLEANELFQKTIHTILVLLLPVTIGLFITSRDVIQLLASGKYYLAAGSLQILSIAIFFSLFAYLCTNCILLPNKRERLIFHASLCSAVVNIVFNCILIPIIGVEAAALTTVLAEAIMCIACVADSRKYANFKMFDKDNISVYVACFSIIIVCMFSRLIGNFYLRLTTEVCGSAIAYFVILVLLRNSIICGFVSELSKKLHRT